MTAPAKHGGGRHGEKRMEQDLIEAISDGVATLTFNRPDRMNALSAPIMDALLEALPRLAGDARSAPSC